MNAEGGDQMNPLLRAYVKDLKVESVKFRLQTSMPHSQIQHNDMMGNFDFNDLDSTMIGQTLGEELQRVENLLNTYNYALYLAEVMKEWNTARLHIQYEGYGYGDESKIRRSRAYCYVLMTRILKKHHKELYKLIKKA